VPLLAEAFLREAQTDLGRTGLTFTEAALAALAAYGWPGNVRELRNVVLRTTVTAPGGAIRPGDLPEEVRCGTSERMPPARSGATILDAPSFRPGHPDRDALVRALEACSWNVAQAAKGLQVSRMTMYRWLRKHGIER
jgi:two-component system response regulator HydG